VRSVKRAEGKRLTDWYEHRTVVLNLSKSNNLQSTEELNEREGDKLFDFIFL
jgi:hypothetical protein